MAVAGTDCQGPSAKWQQPTVSPPSPPHHHNLLGPTSQPASQRCSSLSDYWRLLEVSWYNFLPPHPLSNPSLPLIPSSPSCFLPHPTPQRSLFFFSPLAIARIWSSTRSCLEWRLVLSSRQARAAFSQSPGDVSQDGRRKPAVEACVLTGKRSAPSKELVPGARAWRARKK